MKFVTVRDFRLKPSFVWQTLTGGQEVVLTLNGRPVGILTGTNGDRLEDDLNMIRRVKGQQAMERMQAEAERRGLNKWTMKQVDEFITRVRKDRKK